MGNPYTCLLLCPVCEEITDALGKEISCVTVDEITCNKCKKSFKASSCLKKDKKFSDVILHDKKQCLYIPFNIADYFHR